MAESTSYKVTWKTNLFINQGPTVEGVVLAWQQPYLGSNCTLTSNVHVPTDDYNPLEHEVCLLSSYIIWS